MRRTPCAKPSLNTTALAEALVSRDQDLTKFELHDVVIGLLKRGFVAVWSELPLNQY